MRMFLNGIEYKNIDDLIRKRDENFKEIEKSHGHPSGLIENKKTKKMSIDPLSLLYSEDKGSNILHYYYKIDNKKYEQISNEYVKSVHDASEFQNYRRKILSSIINMDLNIDVKPRHKLLILSDPSSKWFSYGKQAKIPIIYDRTDAWFAINSIFHGSSDDIYCAENADYVICSSKWLYNNTNNKNKIYIPNRASYQEYKPLPKFAKPTAIYAGMFVSKLDYDFIRNLIKNNPDIDFKFYVQDEMPEDLKKYRYDPVSYDDIFKIMLKCNYALLPLNSTDWAAGMLPLKVFQYLNAHLPVLCSDTWNGFCNVEGLPNVYKITSNTRISNMSFNLKPFGKWDWKDIIPDFLDIIHKFI